MSSILKVDQIQLSNGTAPNISDLSIGLPHSDLPTGTVLQVVQGELTSVPSFSSVSGWTDTGLSATITPKSTTSKILVHVVQQMGNEEAGVNFSSRLLRGSTAVGNGIQTTNRNAFAHSEMAITGTQYTLRPHTTCFLDSPSTTSAITYKTQVIQNTTGHTTYINRPHNYSSQQANTRSTITLTEIAG